MTDMDKAELVERLADVARDIGLMYRAEVAMKHARAINDAITALSAPEVARLPEGWRVVRTAHNELTLHNLTDDRRDWRSTEMHPLHAFLSAFLPQEAEKHLVTTESETHPVKQSGLPWAKDGRRSDDLKQQVGAVPHTSSATVEPVSAGESAVGVLPGSFLCVYTNWRGEAAHRRVIPQRVYWGANKWRREPQWLMDAIDLDKGESRTFAMKDMVFQSEITHAPAVVPVPLDNQKVADETSRPETADKPESLAKAFEREQGGTIDDFAKIGGGLPCAAFAWLVRKLDERA